MESALFGDSKTTKAATAEPLSSVKTSDTVTSTNHKETTNPWFVDVLSALAEEGSDTIIPRLQARCAMGPILRQILDQLVAEGLVTRKLIGGYGTYTITEKGERKLNSSKGVQ